MIYKYGESYLDEIIINLIKETKSRIHKDILYYMIYGDINVPDIARKYKISYHAVYQTKRTFQYKIAQLINEKSHLFNYSINCKKAESKNAGDIAYKFQLIKKIS